MIITTYTASGVGISYPSYQDVLDRWFMLSRKLLNLVVNLMASFRKFDSRSCELDYRYEMSVSQITTHMLCLWLPNPFTGFWTWVAWRVPLMEHVSSSCTLWGSCCSILSVLWTIVCFHLAIVFFSCDVRASYYYFELLTLPEHLSSPPVFSGVCVTRSLVLCVCFVDRCLSFFFWPLCCLFFAIRIMITPLVSSNSSWYLLVFQNIYYRP